jgi:UDP-glucose 4-epimerase
MKVLVTGGAGFIGSHLVDALQARGDEVRVLDDLSTGCRENLPEGVRLEVGSVADPDAVAAAVEGCELVFHLAAVASVQRTVEAPLDTHAVNLGGTLNVLEAARAAGVRRVVFAGSAAVYGDNPALPLRESEKPRPLSPYAIEKLGSEQYMRVWSQLYGLETVTLRFFNVFGPRQDPSSPYSGVISIFLDRLRAGRPVTFYGDGGQTRDFVYVADVVQANLLAASVPAADGGVFNVARGQETTIRKLHDTLRALVGRDLEPVLAAPRPGDIRRSLADIGRAREVLGFEPAHSVESGLERLVAWANASAARTGAGRG